MRTLASFENDGHRALAAALAKSEWRTIEQALASLAVFASPRTVDEMNNRPVFRMVRGRSEQRGQIDYDRGVMFDDNRGPTVAFCWATGYSGRTEHLQFNHIYLQSDDVEFYSRLSNMCVTPTFLAKITDRQGAQFLRFRAWELFGLLPPNGAAPKMPDGYDGLEWAPPLDPLADVESTMRQKMSTKPKDRVTQSVRELGWVYSSYKPDPLIDGKSTSWRPGIAQPTSPPSRQPTTSPGAPAVPSFYQLQWPTLRALKAMGGSGTNEQILAKVIELEAIPREVQAVRHNLYQTKLSYNLAWSRTHLKTAEALQKRGRGLWSITLKGNSLPATNFPLGLPRVWQSVSGDGGVKELVSGLERPGEVEITAPTWKGQLRGFLRGLMGRRSGV